MPSTISSRPFPKAAKGVLMLSLFSGLLGCSSSSRIESPPEPSPSETIVAEIGNSIISLQEFKTQFDRTAALDLSVTDTLAAYQDFLSRYVEFRLKVMEARQAGYDTLPDLQTEIKGYRDQLARPYLLEEEVTTPLIQQMHARRAEMVEASHILIRLSPGASPQDTLAAYNRLKTIADSVSLGVDFGVLAQRHSEDPSARAPEGTPGARGYLGYFGGGRMVDEFEDAAYSTPADSVSDIIRTQFGYHVLAVHDRQELPGDIQIAHIMIRPAGATEADTLAALDRIHTAQQQLADGEEFGEVAREFSEDRGSAEAGGVLQRIAYDGGIPETMRAAAYALEPGQVSEVVETPYGFHLVKVLRRFEKESYQEAYDRLIGQIGQMPRAQRAEEAFARRTRIELGGSVDTVFVQSLLDLGPDSLLSMFRKNEWQPDQREKPIAWLADSVYTLQAFTAFFRSQTIPGINDFEANLWRGLGTFLDGKAMDIEIAALETNDARFGRTMQEFRDGLILFRLMEDSVWAAASLDSVAVKARYDANPEAYRFPDRVRIVSVMSSSESVLQRLKIRIESGQDFATELNVLSQDSLTTVRADTMLVDGPTDSVFDAVFSLAPGEVAEPIQYDRGFLLIYHGGVDPARVKTFDEARPQVVNEYQEVLEASLNERLLRKYGVVTYPERLSELVRPGSADDKMR